MSFYSEQWSPLYIAPRHIWTLAIMEQQGPDLLTPPPTNTHIFYKKKTRQYVELTQFSGNVQTEQEVYL